MIRRPGHNRQRGGFTLVELITVMGIMAILVAMIVGAVASVREHYYAESTRALFAGLTAALDSYYRDYSAYPWHDPTTKYPLMSLVASGPEFNPLLSPRDPAFDTDGGNAMLVATLSVPQRRAPTGYFQASGGQVMERQAITQGQAVGRTYRLFVDGWGRPIRYLPPELEVHWPSYYPPRTSPQGSVTWDPGTVNTGGREVSVLHSVNVNGPSQLQGPPVLESLGKEEFDDGDNMFSYGTIKVNGQ